MVDYKEARQVQVFIGSARSAPRASTILVRYISCRFYGRHDVCTAYKVN